MATEIAEIFDAYNAATLNSMATAAGLLKGKKKPSKTQLTLLMHQEFFTPQRIKNSYAQLSSREKQIINRILLRGGETSRKALKRELLRARLVTEAPDPPKPKNSYYNQPTSYVGSPSNPHSTIFEDVMARLTYHGLVFSKPMSAESGYNYKFQFDPEEFLLIPAAVRLHLPAPESLPDEEHLWQPVRVEHGEATRFLRELYLYWDFVRRTEVALLQNGLVSKRHLKLINQALLSPDPLLESVNAEDETGKLQIIRHMLEAQGLIQATHGRLTIINKGKELTLGFWNKSTDKQIADCLQSWLTVENAGETDKSSKQYQPDYGSARRALVTVLQKLPSDRWQEADELLSTLQETRQNFLFPERSKVESQKGRSYYYYNYGYNSGSPTEILKKMDEAESNFVQRCGAGFLFQCGLIELGYASEQTTRWQALRLTALGRTLLTHLQPNATAKSALRLAESSEPYQTTSDQGRIVVQPNFQILAIGPVSLGLLAQIDLFAERRKADIGVFEYHLARDSVYSAQQLGMNVTAIRTFLQETTGMPLPQNVSRTLDEWGAHHERIIFRSNVHLLQAADEALLQKLLEIDEVGMHLARALAPGVALVKKQHNDKLLKGLLQNNLLPAVSGDQPSAADHSVMMDKQGLIQPIHAVPSLHLSGRLARFAEPQAEGRWQITPATVRRVGGNRKKVLELLEEMARLQRGSLPAGLVDQVKTWGAYFGEASTGVLTLIEFRDRNALEELAKRPKLQALLTPFHAGDRAMAVVAEGRLSEVQTLLSELGVILKTGLAR